MAIIYYLSKGGSALPALTAWNCALTASVMLSLWQNILLQVLRLISTLRMSPPVMELWCVVFVLNIYLLKPTYFLTPSPKSPKSKVM